MVKKMQIWCIFIALVAVLAACSPVTTTVTEVDMITTTNITTVTGLPSKTSSTISTTVPAFFAAVTRASQDSVSLEVEWSATDTTGNTVSIKSKDPRFIEVLNFLGSSSLKRIMTKTGITTENGTTTTIQRTIPYAWGYVITFSLKDSSTLKFNCAIDSIWFETDQAIYETSFSDEFRSFLDVLTQQPVEVVSVSSPYKPGDTIIPAGPKIEITLKNISNEPVIFLTALLIEEGVVSSPWTFNFNVTLIDPLLPGHSISVTNILIGGGFGGGIPYSLAINGTLQDGTSFAFMWEHLN